MSRRERKKRFKRYGDDNGESCKEDRLVHKLHDLTFRADNKLRVDLSAE